MKNLFLIIAVIFTAQTMTQAQEVSEKSWTVIHERFATWCPFCGTWGWDLKERMLEEFKNDDVIFMSLDHSGDLTNDVAKEFDSNFKGSGQPIFYVNGVNINASSSNGSSKIQDTRLEVDYYKDLIPISALGLDATLNQDSKKIDVNALVRFVQEAESGDYYLGLYLLEDIWANQASRTGLQLHKNVLVGSFLPNVFNNHLTTGSVAQGTEFQMSGSIENISGDADNYKVMGVVWAYNNLENRFLFNNAYITDVKVKTSTKDKENAATNFNAYQAESGNIVVSFEGDTQLSSSSELILSEMSGSVIKKLSSKDLNTKSIQINANYVPGVHIITVKNGGVSTSKKIVLF